MKTISDRDYDTIVRAARVLKGMRHSDAAIANALRHIVAVGRKWARIAQKHPSGGVSLFK